MPADTSAQHAEVQPARDHWVLAGVTVTALAAAASSFTGLRELATFAGCQTKTRSTVIRHSYRTP